VLAAGVLLLVLAGCGRSVQDRLAQARQSMERKDRAAALIQVKSVLQGQPDQGEARLLLGRLLLDGGDPVAAEIELRRALELGQSEVQVLPVLARALLAANQSARLVLQFGQVNLPDALAAAQLKSAVAEAEALQGDLQAARQSLDLALREAPDFVPALLLRARVSAVDGDLPDALAQVDALLARNPGSADGWVLKGDLLARQDADPAEVLRAYQQALAVKPDHANAHAALVAQYLARHDVAAARTQHEAMRKLLPRHPLTLLFEGQIAYLGGDLAHAREVFQDLLRVLPEHVPLLQSAGAVELRLNAPVQAEVLLSRAVQLAPDNVGARRLLAQCYLALAQPERALGALEPVTGPDRADAEALTLAAQAQLQAGQPAAAAALFDRAARLRPDDPKIRTAVALSHLARGQTEAALAELQAVAKADADTTADLALIAAQLRRGKPDAALKAIDALQRKQPRQPMAAHLRGQVLLQQHDRTAARQAFEQALALDADYFPSVAALAGLDLLDQHPDAARGRLEAMVKRRPRDAQARLALAELATRTGADRDAVTALYEQGIKANPGDASLRLALVDHHLATANPKAAMNAAQAALAQLPDHFELLGRLGHAQLLAGEHQQALSTFNAMVRLRGNSPAGPLGLAETQLAANDLTSAQRSVQRALALAPRHLGAQRLGITVALRQRQPDRALALAREVQQQRPDQAVGFLLEGEIDIAAKQWDAAITALRQAITKTAPAQAPGRLHHALRQAGRSAEADALAASWLRSHPGDALFRFYLGDVALAQQDLAGAEARYRAVLEVAPDHALSLNNIAWLLLAQHKPGALDYAERAVRAAPDQPQLLDTLAQAQASEDHADQAVATQQRALAIQPDDPALRLNLARYLVQAGNKRQAKVELDRLALLGDRFDRQGEVHALAQSLGGR
jgi:putative PEP-CTERM system TPR-repeat lipoprotein